MQALGAISTPLAFAMVAMENSSFPINMKISSFGDGHTVPTTTFTSQRSGAYVRANFCGRAQRQQQKQTEHLLPYTQVCTPVAQGIHLSSAKFRK
jgi:hypothetical protein